jgi:hypothetical protein
LTKPVRRPRKVDLGEIIPVDGDEGSPESESDLEKAEYATSDDDDDTENYLEFIDEVAAYNLPEPREGVEVGETGLSEVQLLQLHEHEMEILLDKARDQGLHEGVVGTLLTEGAGRNGAERDITEAMGEIHDVLGDIKGTRQKIAKRRVIGTLKLYISHKELSGHTNPGADVPVGGDFEKEDINNIFEELDQVRSEGDPLSEAASNDLGDIPGDRESDFAERLAEYEGEERKEDVPEPPGPDESSDDDDREPEPQGDADDENDADEENDE